MFGGMAIRRLLAIAGLALATLAAAETGVTDGSILIGQSVPLTGPAQELGIEMRLGAKLYFDHINSQGGVNGHSLPGSIWIAAFHRRRASSKRACRAAIRASKSNSLALRGSSPF